MRQTFKKYIYFYDKVKYIETGAESERKMSAGAGGKPLGGAKLPTE